MTTLERVTVPESVLADFYPEVTVAELEARLQPAVDAMGEDALDHIVVYADREHSANHEYLCGMAPRFEESLLILGRDGRRSVVLGNECQNYTPDPALNIEVMLFQDFSPPGQQRDKPLHIRELLKRAGIDKRHRVGVLGSKALTAGFVDGPRHALDIPSYVADALRDVVGDPLLAINVTDLMIDPEQGLRLSNTAADIARAEYAASVTSASVRSAILNLRVGVSERELERFLVPRGLPLTCHSMISFGEKVRRGLSSPSDRTASVGAPFVVAFGVQGALSCRAGMVAAGPSEVAADTRDFYADFSKNYFDVVATWYESVQVGVTSGAVFDAAERVREPALFSFLLPPGHFLSIEEWVQSSFHRNSTTVLKSGSLLQSDVIPVSGGPFVYNNLEDGIALADKKLQDELRRDFPDLMMRADTRRAFLCDVLGIQIDQSVIPLSNAPGWLAPYVLEPDLAYVR